MQKHEYRRIEDINLFDEQRSRKIPIRIVLPSKPVEKTIIFSAGYCSQEDLKEGFEAYKKYQFLAEYFIDRNFAFICVQHDVLGDSDGLETIDASKTQHEAREHLYKRGIININYILLWLKQNKPNIKIDDFIIGGHSNGGDIAKYFINKQPEICTNIIVFDARRCRIETNKAIKLLMFEASDTTTDANVLPNVCEGDNVARDNISYVIIKPKNALHGSYLDENINDDLKVSIFKALDYFI